MSVEQFIPRYNGQPPDSLSQSIEQKHQIKQNLAWVEAGIASGKVIDLRTRQKKPEPN